MIYATGNINVKQNAVSLSQGIHGRLGDLGSIDDKYDVAVIYNIINNKKLLNKLELTLPFTQLISSDHNCMSCAEQHCC